MIEQGVRQDNTWLVVDPIVGCAHDCQYCFLQIYGKTRQKGKVIMSPQEAVDRLVDYWAFRENSMIMIGSETDMFMSTRNISFLSQFVRIYSDSGIRNPLSLSTKRYIPDDFIKLVQGLEGITVIFYVSYSGLPGDIEPYIDEEEIRSNFVRLASADQKTIHLWRPMVPQNSTPDALERVMEGVYKHATCSVMRGLNLNEELQKRIWFWPEARDASIDFSQVVSLWPDHARANVAALMRDYPDHPLLFKNSCGLAYVLGIPEFVGIHGTERCRRSWCPEDQRLICETYTQTRQWPTRERVVDELRKMGLDNSVAVDREEGRILIKGTMNHEQVACLSQVLRCKLEVETIHSEHEWGGYVLGHDDRKVQRSE